MLMQRHILEALREERAAWNELLAGLSEAQITAPRSDGRSVKDDVAHLWAWQQRTLARAEAALHDREPEFPDWPAQFDAEEPGEPDRLNQWLYEASRDRPWPAVSAAWREQYDRIIELGASISERDLLDSTRYSWLDGHSLAMILIATYDHHQEHLDLLQTWLGEPGAVLPDPE